MALTATQIYVILTNKKSKNKDIQPCVAKRWRIITTTVGPPDLKVNKIVKCLRQARELGKEQNAQKKMPVRTYIV